MIIETFLYKALEIGVPIVVEKMGEKVWKQLLAPIQKARRSAAEKMAEELGPSFPTEAFLCLNFKFDSEIMQGELKKLLSGGKPDEYSMKQEMVNELSGFPQFADRANDIVESFLKHFESECLASEELKGLTLSSIIREEGTASRQFFEDKLDRQTEYFEAWNAEQKELLLQIRAQTKKDDQLPDANFIQSLSQDELLFFLINIFTYHFARKSQFTSITGKDEWEVLLNRHKVLFKFQEDKGSYYGHLKEGYAFRILTLIKSKPDASKKLIDFFSFLFFKHHGFSVDVATLGSAQTMIVNLSLLPVDIGGLLDQLLEKAESRDSYNNYGNIIENMAIALFENITEIDLLCLKWLERFMMAKNSMLRASIGERAVKYFNVLPSEIKEDLFSLLNPVPYRKPTFAASEPSVYPALNCIIRFRLLPAFMDVYEDLPDNYQKRFDAIMADLKYEEDLSIKGSVANHLIINKTPDFKYYPLLDDILADDSIIEHAIGGSVLGILSKKEFNNYEYALGKIMSIKEELKRYQSLLNNFFDLDKQHKNIVEEYINRNINSYHAQLFASTIGEHLNLDSDDYMETLEKFMTLSNSSSKSIKIGIILGVVFNCRNIPRPTREDILNRYANSEEHDILEQIIRAVMENWAQFSDNMKDIVFNIVKKINYRGCYIKNNYEALTEPYKIIFKEYL